MTSGVITDRPVRKQDPEHETRTDLSYTGAMDAMTRKNSAKRRLLEAADRLFYEEGIHQVGIDRVIEEAGVAKSSLYYAFGSKDELVKTYLADRHAKWDARLIERMAGQDAPRDKILSIFDALGELFAEPSFNGCAFINAAAEAPPGSAEDSATHDFRTWLHELFSTLCAQLGVQDPNELSEQLVFLYDGANISAQMDRNRTAASTARAAADALLRTSAYSMANKSAAT
jgi:AcrR family transcriptional regulator